MILEMNFMTLSVNFYTVYEPAVWEHIPGRFVVNARYGYIVLSRLALFEEMLIYKRLTASF